MNTSEFLRESCEDIQREIKEFSTPERDLQLQKDLYNRFGKIQCLKFQQCDVYPFNVEIIPWNRIIDKSRHYSKTMLWYEVTTTHPDKNKERKDLMIKSLMNYCQADSFEGHFEIGKGGLYHYHFKIGTYKYLRKKQIENINDKYRVSCSLIRDMDAFDRYINKKPENVKGWCDVV